MAGVRVRANERPPISGPPELSCRVGEWGGTTRRAAPWIWRPVCVAVTPGKRAARQAFAVRWYGEQVAMVAGCDQPDVVQAGVGQVGEGGMGALAGVEHHGPRGCSRCAGWRLRVAPDHRRSACRSRWRTG